MQTWGQDLQLPPPGPSLAALTSLWDLGKGSRWRAPQKGTGPGPLEKVEGQGRKVGHSCQQAGPEMGAAVQPASPGKGIWRCRPRPASWQEEMGKGDWVLASAEDSSPPKAAPVPDP